MNVDTPNSLDYSLMRASENPAYVKQFYQDFLKADIFFIQSQSQSQSQSGASAEPKHIQIQEVQIQNKRYIPIFSSLSHLQQVISQEVSYGSVKGEDFLRMSEGHDLLLNPGSQYAKEFTKSEVASLIHENPGVENTLGKGNKIYMGSPTNEPKELIEVLCALFQKNKQIKKAYLAQILIEGQDEKPHTLVGIEVSGSWNELMREIGVATRSIQIPEPPLDFLQLGTGDPGIENYLTKETKPFYIRKRFGVFK